MIRNYECKLYPNKEQREKFELMFSGRRFVWNYFLEYRQKHYEETGTSLTYFDTCNLLTEFKRGEELAWLKTVDVWALRYALFDLDLAFKAFFKKNSRYPRFISKEKGRKTYRTCGQNVSITDKHVKLPKIGMVRCRGLERICGNVKQATISLSPSGKYLIVFSVDVGDVRKENAGGVLGLAIDANSSIFYVDSNGNVVEDPCFYQNAERRIAAEQEKLSHKEKGSTNYEKQRIRIARLHEKVANQRKDFLHKLTTQLASENALIVGEKADFKDAVQEDDADAKSALDASYGMFFQMLQYKMAEHGGELLLVDPEEGEPNELLREAKENLAKVTKGETAA